MLIHGLFDVEHFYKPKPSKRWHNDRAHAKLDSKLDSFALVISRISAIPSHKVMLMNEIKKLQQDLLLKADVSKLLLDSSKRIYIQSFLLTTRSVFQSPFIYLIICYKLNFPLQNRMLHRFLWLMSNFT